MESGKGKVEGGGGRGEGVRRERGGCEEGEGRRKRGGWRRERERGGCEVGTHSATVLV